MTFPKVFTQKESKSALRNFPDRFYNLWVKLQQGFANTHACVCGEGRVHVQARIWSLTLPTLDPLKEGNCIYVVTRTMCAVLKRWEAWSADKDSPVQYAPFHTKGLLASTQEESRWKRRGLWKAYSNMTGVALRYMHF